jgi:hypothetical protein
MTIEDKRYVQELCFKYYDEYLERVMAVEERLTKVEDDIKIIEEWARDRFGGLDKIDRKDY